MKNIICRQIMMEEEIRVSVEHVETTKITHIDFAATIDTRTEDTLNSILNILLSYIECIKKHPKMSKFLQEIQINSQQLVQSYERIIQSLKELHNKSHKNKTAYNTLSTVWEHLQTFLKTKNLQKVDTKGKLVWLLEVQVKIGCSVGLMHDIKNIPDITNSPKESYPQVWQRVTFKKPKDIKSLINDTKKTKKMLHVAASAVINESAQNFSLIKLVSFGVSFPRYMIMNDSAKLRSFKFYRTPTIEIAQNFWNLPEKGTTKQFIKATYKGVGTNRKIYLPCNGEFNNKTDIFTQDPQKITVRILYSKKLHIFQQGEPGYSCVSSKKQPQFIDTVIMHMHGGGFIALSSRSTQSYTRKWADELNVPIFSVDYRMPPNHPFPTAPNDCLLVYEFLLNHVHKFMNIKPTNVYLSGDSAGGNLACVLTGLILKKKLTIPRGIYVAYPAVDLRLTFSRSKIYSLTDVLLWPSMLLLCLNQYLSHDFKKAENPMASPILIDEEYVNGSVGDKRFPLNWPKTIVTVGSKDPLLDDSLMLMQKMTESKVQCECIIYEEFAHGYLSTTMLIDQTKSTVADSIEHLKKMMSIQEGKK